MIYLKKFGLFLSVAVGLMILLTINAVVMSYIDGTDYGIIVYLVSVLAFLAILDVQADKWLERRRKRLEADFDAHMKQWEELQEALKKAKNRAKVYDEL